MKYKVITAIMLFFTMINPLAIFASQYIESDGNQVSFSVRAILPENQFSEASFFEIEMEPGQIQELEVVITNSSEEDIEVEVESYTGATNSNGVITYDGSITEFDDSMKYSFSDISETVHNPVYVPAQSQESAIVRLEAPEESFDGQIIGGLRFQLVDEEEEQEEAVSVLQKFAYIIGVTVVEKGNTTLIEPDLELINVSVEELSNQNRLQTVFVNKTPVLIKNLNFEGHIYSADNDNEVIYSREVARFSVAPHNIFNYPIAFEEGNLIPGDYVFRGTASNEDYKWEFEKEFTID